MWSIPHLFLDSSVWSIFITISTLLSHKALTRIFPSQPLTSLCSGQIPKWRILQRPFYECLINVTLKSFPTRETLNQVKIRFELTGFYLLAWEAGTSQVNWFSFPGVHSKAWLWLTKRQNTPPINSFRSIFSLQIWSWELSILKWNDLARVHPDLYSISLLRFGISSTIFC